jgi:hypothetical protein
MTNTKRGNVGKEVFWTTSDMGCSYEPCIHFGDFTLFIGRGRSWDAQNDDAARVSLTVLKLTPDEETTEDVELGAFPAELFLTTSSLRAACAYLVARHLDTILAQVGSETLLQDIVVAADQLVKALQPE